MASLKIPRSYDQFRVLLADDEPEHLDWLIDYLKTKGYQTTVVTDVRGAMKAIQATSFRAYLIDLNIPLGGWIPSISAPGSTYHDYHGFYLLKLIRSQGNAGARVLAYSAHSNEQITKEIKRLYCKYVTKGRPGDLKKELDLLLKTDPKAKRLAKRRSKQSARVSGHTRIPRGKTKN